MDTRWYQVSEPEKFEFYLESDQLDVDAVLRPGIVTPFSLTAFDDLEKEVSPETPILLDEEKDNENSPTTPVSKRPTRSTALVRIRLFGTRTENVPECVYRSLFQIVIKCMCFKIKLI